MNIKHIFASLFSLTLILSASAETRPGPLPENAVRIKNIDEADLVGRWRYEKEMTDVVAIDRDGSIIIDGRYVEEGTANATEIEYMTIRADHTATDSITVDTQVGDTLRSELAFQWSYDADTRKLAMTAKFFTEAINGAHPKIKPLPPEATADIMMWTLDDQRILGLNTEYGDTIYYTEITNSQAAGQ